MTERRFVPGFRFSALDIAILIGGVLAAIVAVPFSHWLSSAIAWVVAHFFLFCNVFRVSRPLELAWAGIFILLWASTSTLAMVYWPIALAMSFCATVVVIVLEMRKPSYHGVGWQWINPNLRQWWRSHGVTEKAAQTTTADRSD